MGCVGGRGHRVPSQRLTVPGLGLAGLAGLAVPGLAVPDRF